MNARRPGKRGGRDFAQIARAVVWSCKGLRAAWREEFAFRVELSVCAVMLPAAFYVGGNLAERWLLFASCVLVLVLELVNSSIEAVVDRIGPERHPLSGMAKDLAAAAVFLCVLLAGVVWGSALWERFF